MPTRARRLRYWAGKGVGQLGEAPRITREEQKKLLDASVAAIEDEPNPEVFHQLLVGMVGLSIPEATYFLLHEINKRIPYYAKHPQVSPSAASGVMRKLFVTWVQSISRGQETPEELLELITIVAYRYLALSAAILDTQQAKGTVRAEYVDIVQLSDTILGWGARLLLPAEDTRPKSVKRELDIENWPEVRLRAEEWRRLLAGPRFQIPNDQLTVVLPDEP